MDDQRGSAKLEPRFMPISALTSHKFNDETVRLMGLAFEMALAALRHACPDPLREALAGKIIELGKSASATQSVCMTTP
jgi:hypothetical protein